MTKGEALRMIECLDCNDISYFMDNYAYDGISDSKIWREKLIEYIKTDYYGEETTLKSCIDVFNKYYWYSYINSSKTK